MQVARIPTHPLTSHTKLSFWSVHFKHIRLVAFTLFFCRQSLTHAYVISSFSIHQQGVVITAPWSESEFPRCYSLGFFPLIPC